MRIAAYTSGTRNTQELGVFFFVPESKEDIQYKQVMSKGHRY